MIAPSNLMSILNFTEQDLIHNRRGILSPEQRLRLQQRAYIRISTTLGGSLLTLVIGYLIVRGSPETTSGIFILGTVIISLMLILLVRAVIWLYLINQGEVIIITGALYRSEGESGKVQAQIPVQGFAGAIVSILFNLMLRAIWYRLFPVFILTIGSSRFQVNRRLYTAFTARELYQIYCLNQEIIAAELLKA
ncbi:MAG: hypothetical protein H7X77_03725 [Anaerolineae bacterium]|nr:hypothetical protein [Anaerolineae bacterium]